jgi:hypothetical protein
LESFSHNELKAIMQKFVNTTLHFDETPLINFQSPYYNYSITDLSLYRASDKYHFSSPPLPPSSVRLSAIFSGRRHNSL